LSPDFQRTIAARVVHGSTVDRILLTELPEYPVEIPELRDQQRIAHILGTLDDKIELNRRMNRTLEAIARAIFKSWFIDFDPVIDNVILNSKPIPDGFAERAAVRREILARSQCGEVLPSTSGRGAGGEGVAGYRHLFPDSFQDSPLGKIPMGWAMRTLSEVAEVVDCLHSKKPEQRESGQLLLQVYNVAQHGDLDLSKPYWINGKDFTEWTRRMELAPGDLVVTKTGRVGAVAQIPSGVRAALGRNMVGVRSRSGSATSRFLRCLLTSVWMRREMEGMTSDGTILRSLHAKAIEKLRLAIPPFELLGAFESMCDSILGLTESNTSASYSLGQTRDTLLPKLLSGRLSQRCGDPQMEEK
jgi:type I restriction enzyme S subunit